MADAILEAVHLSKFFPQRGGILRRSTAIIRAVDGVSCSLHSGKTLGLV